MSIESIDSSLLYNAYTANVTYGKETHSQEFNTQNVENNESYENQDSTLHNAAVDLSISMESIKVFLNLKSVEVTKDNTTAQNALMNLTNNTELFNFLSGKELESGFSLSSIGYDGKPITELSAHEAQDLVSDNGFFGITQTSDRVSSFVLNLSGDNLEALQESRKGVVQGFNEAEKMWGGTLPEISYETQERTLKIIDEKIAKLLQTDAQKELEETGNE